MGIGVTPFQMAEALMTLSAIFFFDSTPSCQSPVNLKLAPICGKMGPN